MGSSRRKSRCVDESMHSVGGGDAKTSKTRLCRCTFKEAKAWKQRRKEIRRTMFCILLSLWLILLPLTTPQGISSGMFVPLYLLLPDVCRGFRSGLQSMLDSFGLSTRCELASACLHKIACQPQSWPGRLAPSQPSPCCLAINSVRCWLDDYLAAVCLSLAGWPPCSHYTHTKVNVPTLSLLSALPRCLLRHDPFPVISFIFTLYVHQTIPTNLPHNRAPSRLPAKLALRTSPTLSPYHAR